eukprot:797744-Amorphochlora_amoeboformis.AAC.1
MAVSFKLCQSRTCYLSTKTNRFARTPAHYSVNDTLGLVYQEIPKAASRSIRKTMGKILCRVKSIVFLLTEQCASSCTCTTVTARDPLAHCYHLI